MDILQLQMGKKPNSPLCMSFPAEVINNSSIDSSFGKALSERTNRYMHLANEYSKFRGILLDLLPEYKREVNVLSQLLSVGIVEDLKKERQVNQFLASRYIKKMSNDYGYDEALIKEIVNVWCKVYLDDLIKACK